MVDLIPQMMWKAPSVNVREIAIICCVKLVEIDATGRLLIPKDLMAFADIKKDVVLSSAVNILEIWDKEKYEQTIEDTAVDFADLAEEVMGFEDDNDGIS